ncbi:MAG: hypothetical protein JKY53_00095 [Flavobacteriales bacterium]|nr:hypothetical protein [Flavobacteriales bacterium]
MSTQEFIKKVIKENLVIKGSYDSGKKEMTVALHFKGEDKPFSKYVIFIPG